MRRRREQRIDAYRDGALSAADRERVERLLDSDPESAARLSDTEALGRAIRAAWTEGPPPPPTEYLIAALRPALARADIERATDRSLAARLRETLSPVPLALACAAAAVLLLAWPTVTGLNGPDRALRSEPTQVAQAVSGDRLLTPVSEGAVAAPAAIYDLAQEDRPLMIFEGLDGSTVIWILREEENVSFMAVAADGWV